MAAADVPVGARGGEVRRVEQWGVGISAEQHRALAGSPGQGLADALGALSTPASELTVINACRRVCGVTCLAIWARRVTRRTIRAAPCRPSRRPSAVRNSGPSARSPGGQLDRPGGARGKRDGDRLAALAGDDQGAVAALEAWRLDAGAGRF